MLLNPLPGVVREHLRDVLRDLHIKVGNIASATSSDPTHRRLLAYLDWTNQAARVLHHLVRTPDVSRLVLTKRYELLVSMIGRFGPDMTFPAVNDLLAAELDERRAAFEEAHRALDRLD